MKPREDQNAPVLVHFYVVCSNHWAVHGEMSGDSSLAFFSRISFMCRLKSGAVEIEFIRNGVDVLPNRKIGQVNDLSKFDKAI